MAHRCWSKFVTKLRQKCPPILMDVTTLPCETKHKSILFISAVTYVLKSWKLRRNIIANVQCLLLALRHALKQSSFWSIAWSMKLCWLLTTYQLHATSAHWRPSLVADNMFMRFGFSWCLQALVHRCGFHAARGESETCILLWCLAAQTAAARHLSSCWRLLLSSAPHMHKSTELLWHKTPNFTPEVASQQTRPQFCRLQIIDSHSRMRLSKTAKNVKHRWWAVVINRITFY